MSNKKSERLIYLLSELVSIEYKILLKKDNKEFVEVCNVLINEKKEIKEEEELTIEIVIPNFINDIPVESIGANSFKGVRGFKVNVTLPEGIRRIGRYAFKGSNNIYFNKCKLDNLIYIGEDVFSNRVRNRFLKSFSPDPLYTKTPFGDFLTKTLSKRDLFTIKDFTRDDFNFYNLENKSLEILQKSNKCVDIDNIYYLVDDNKAYVIGVSPRFCDKHVHIKDNIDFMETKTDVVGICSNAFENKDFITKIYFGKNIEFVGCSAFYNCKNLEYVEVNELCKYIADKAFFGTKISFIYLPKSIESIGHFELGFYNSWLASNSFFNCFFEGNYRISNKVSYSYDAENEDIIIKKDKISDENLRIIWHLNFRKENILINDSFAVHNDDNKGLLLKIFNESIVNGEDYSFPSKIIIEDKEIPITRIGSCVINDENKYINSLIIPASIEKIESAAIRLSEVDELVFENDSQLKYIGEKGLDFHLLAKELIFPKSIEVLGDNLFDRKSTFDSIKFEENSKLKVMCFSFSNNYVYELELPSSMIIFYENSDKIYNLKFTHGEIKLKQFCLPTSTIIKSAKLIDNGYYLGNDVNPNAIFLCPSNKTASVCIIKDGTILVNKNAFERFDLRKIVIPNSLKYFNVSYISSDCDINIDYKNSSLERLSGINYSHFKQSHNYIPNKLKYINIVPRVNCKYFETLNNPYYLGIVNRNTTHVENDTKILYFDYYLKGIKPTNLPEKVEVILGYQKENFKDCKLKEYEGCKYLSTENNPYYMLVDAKRDLIKANIHPNCVIVGDEAFKNCQLLEEIVFSGNKVRCVGANLIGHHIKEIRLPASIKQFKMNNLIQNIYSPITIENICFETGGSHGYSSSISESILHLYANSILVDEKLVEEEIDCKIEITKNNEDKSETIVEPNFIDREKAKLYFDKLVSYGAEKYLGLTFESLNEYEVLKLLTLSNTKKYDHIVIDGVKIIYEEFENSIIIRAFRGFKTKDFVNVPDVINSKHVEDIIKDKIIGDIILPDNYIDAIELSFDLKQFYGEKNNTLNNLFVQCISTNVLNKILVSPNTNISPDCVFLDTYGNKIKSLRHVHIPNNHKSLIMTDNCSLYSKDYETLYYLGEGDKIDNRCKNLELLFEQNLDVLSSIEKINKNVTIKNYHGVVNVNVLEQASIKNEYIQNNIIKLGDKVEYINEYSFNPTLFDYYIRNKTQIKIEVDENNPYITVYEDSIYTKDLKKLLVFNNYGKTHIKFPEELEIVDRYSFENLGSIQTLEFGKNIKKIPSTLINRGPRNIYFNTDNTIEIECNNSYYANELKKNITKYLPDENYSLVGIPKASSDGGLIEIEPQVYSFADEVTEVKQNLHIFSNNRNTLLIHAKIEKISPDFFFGIDKYISNIVVDTENKHFIVIDKCLYSKDKSILYFCFNKSSKKVFTFKEEVKVIGHYAFKNCKFSEYIFNNNLKEIGRYAFGDCLMKKLELPDGLKVIKSHAFENCIFLENANIPNVERMESNIFFNCPNLSKINFDPRIQILSESLATNLNSLRELDLPDYLLALEANFFNYGNGKLKIGKHLCHVDVCATGYYFEVNKENPYFYSIDGVLYEKKTDILLMVPSSIDGVFKVPDTCKGIHKNTFAVSKIKELYLPNNGYFTDIDKLKINNKFDRKITRIDLYKGEESLLDKVLNFNVDEVGVQINSGARTLLDNSEFIDIIINEDEIVGLIKDPKLCRGIQKVTITLDSSNLLYFSCNCNYSSNKLCKHVLALIIQIQKDNGQIDKTLKDSIASISLGYLVKKNSYGGQDVIERGNVLASDPEKNIKIINVNSNEVVAQVLGSTDYYDINLYMEKGLLRYKCSCPFDNSKKGACKHVLALIIHLKNNPSLFDGNKIKQDAKKLERKREEGEVTSKVEKQVNATTIKEESGPSTSVVNKVSKTNSNGGKTSTSPDNSGKKTSAAKSTQTNKSSMKSTRTTNSTKKPQSTISSTTRESKGTEKTASTGMLGPANIAKESIYYDDRFVGKTIEETLDIKYSDIDKEFEIYGDDYHVTLLTEDVVKTYTKDPRGMFFTEARVEGRKLTVKCDCSMGDKGNTKFVCNHMWGLKYGVNKYIKDNNLNNRVKNISTDINSESISSKSNINNIRHSSKANAFSNKNNYYMIFSLAAALCLIISFIIMMTVKCECSYEVFPGEIYSSYINSDFSLSEKMGAFNIFIYVVLFLMSLLMPLIIKQNEKIKFGHLGLSAISFFMIIASVKAKNKMENFYDNFVTDVEILSQKLVGPFGFGIFLLVLAIILHLISFYVKYKEDSDNG